MGLCRFMQEVIEIYIEIRYSKAEYTYILPCFIMSLYYFRRLPLCKKVANVNAYCLSLCSEQLQNAPAG